MSDQAKMGLTWASSQQQAKNATNDNHKRKWVGLTDEELEFYTEELGQGELGRGVLRAVDDFLKEKNT